ncbi:MULTISPECIES: hypothetical protein [Bradyrhizobium]|uniref:Uncharacterized protein n=1 Tax=Bradyrhizobium arachidis TaxID=858423 RepID=A0AAE7NHT5_9BRAD|nr:MULTISPECIES: hypothetical protein [Bradyrhizobium]QOG21203.1 hypothetical protein FOM02_31720 [Bradyrhizobium sp. SEMIA]QOZ65312.1 hypothetical protein WN72_01735 [Bradyrhizobium arachidis]UFW49837.1 hypothetical protein BaraCB756_01760 [Bradyrhizobium arachidis]SFV15533.1 hypothetical protein SAMN05192541_123125 [Bradyrhizobium arachidis]
MPTHVSLTSIPHPRTARGLNDVLPGELLPLLAFSLAGVAIDGLAAFEAYSRQGPGFAGLLLVLSAPVLAAAAAFCVAHPRELPTDRRR